MSRNSTTQRDVTHAGEMPTRASRTLADDQSSVYVAFAQGKHALAGAIATSLEQHEANADNPRLRAELLLLRAESARRGGDTDAARAAALRAESMMRLHKLSLPLRSVPREAAEELHRLAPGLPIELSLPSSARAVTPLTPAEEKTLLSVARHGSTARAAEALFLSPETVKWQLKQVYRKLGVRTRAEAIRVAGDAGLLREGLSDA